jgi:hypothetical protein
MLKILWGFVYERRSLMRKVIVVVFIGVFLTLSLTASAQGQVVIGFGFPYPYPYYGYYPYLYGYPYYYPYAYSYPYYDSYRYNPPTVYVESEQPFYWYFCGDSQTYYPYVTSCPGGWTKVIPTPPEAEKEGKTK